MAEKRKAPSRKAPAKGGEGSGLSKKIGPLPLWGWIVAAVVVWYVYTKSSSSSSTGTSSATGGTATPVTGSSGTGYYGGGGSSGGGGSGGSSGLATTIANAVTQGLQQAGITPIATPTTSQTSPQPNITIQVEPTGISSQPAAPSGQAAPASTPNTQLSTGPNASGGYPATQVQASYPTAPTSFAYTTIFTNPNSGTVYYGLGNSSSGIQNAARAAGYTITTAKAAGVPGGSTKALYAYKS